MNRTTLVLVCVALIGCATAVRAQDCAHIIEVPEPATMLMTGMLAACLVARTRTLHPS